MSDHQKAFQAAQFVHITQVDELGRPTEAIVPAQHGEYATVTLARKGAAVHIVDCVHRKILVKKEAKRCEANENGLVCYHAKAVLVWIGEAKGSPVVFCESEEAARKLAEGGGRAANLWTGNKSQWLVFLPNGTDPEEERRAQEVAHLTRALQPLLEAIKGLEKPKRK